MRDEPLLVPSPNCTIGQPRARRDASTAATRWPRGFFPTSARRRHRGGNRDLSCSYYGGEETLIVARSGSRFGPQAAYRDVS